MKKIGIIILVIVILVILGFLGYKYIYKKNYSSNTPSTNTPSVAQTLGQPNSILIENFSFNPSEITIAKDVEVTFKNDDSANHNITFENFQSGDMKPGDTYKHTFDSTGTFNYYCSLHPQMKGKIIVQ
ncbi:MAG: cupredoxin family copper-binding protein [Patescibacteria group bacterium]|jgi:plastocyanin